MPLTSEIQDYRPDSPDRFEAEKRLIQTTVGSYLREIHHVGSTAIPGIMGKPEIDILIICESLGDIDRINAGMARLGYDVRGEDGGLPGRHYYSKNVGGKRTHKAHVCEHDHPDARQMIVFRDYLCARPDAARKYERLKVELAARDHGGMREYLDGKAPLIEQLVKEALAEGY